MVLVILYWKLRLFGVMFVLICIVICELLELGVIVMLVGMEVLLILWMLMIVRGVVGKGLFIWLLFSMLSVVVCLCCVMVVFGIGCVRGCVEGMICSCMIFV